MAKQNPTPKKEDTVIYRAMADLAIVIAAILLLPVIRRGYGDPDAFFTWRAAFLWIAICGGVLTVASAIAAIATHGKTRKAFTVAAVALGVIALCALALYVMAFEAIPYLYFLVIAGGALYLIYLLYPLDFVLIALLSTLTGAAFYLHGAAGMLTRSTTVLYAITAVLIVLDILLAKRAIRHSGKVYFGKKGFRFYAKKGGAMPTYIAGAILLACIAAALLIGSVFARYCVYGVAAVLFIFACYYTFQLD